MAAMSSRPFIFHKATARALSCPIGCMDLQYTSQRAPPEIPGDSLLCEGKGGFPVEPTGVAVLVRTPNSKWIPQNPTDGRLGSSREAATANRRHVLIFLVVVFFFIVNNYY